MQISPLWRRWRWEQRRHSSGICGKADRICRRNLYLYMPPPSQQYRRQTSVSEMSTPPNITKHTETTAPDHSFTKRPREFEWVIIVEQTSSAALNAQSNTSNLYPPHAPMLSLLLSMYTVWR